MPQVELDKLKFFAKPKLALDAVGGTSAVRLCEALAEVSGRTHMLTIAVLIATCLVASITANGSKYSASVQTKHK